jgi:DNA-binding CsgD family transcriptional regulator
VPNTIWDKAGPLGTAAWERVRLHTYYTERVLAGSSLLAPFARVAGLHHEHTDGSGYHRGVRDQMFPPAARILAAADAYHAMTETRAYRPALTATEAASEIAAGVERGWLDRGAAGAVCEAAGQRIAAPRSWPAGLTDREVEVLRLLARGRSKKQIAAQLGIAEGTVHTHVVHVYEKIGVSSRALAALFAMEHGLIEPEIYRTMD